MSSRNVLGIPKDALVVLLIADHLTNARKGMSFALEALRQIEIPLILLSAGSGELESVRHARVHIGPLANDFLLPVLYSAADLMLLPSQQENQALTMLEAMGCGTPVVGVTAGGTPETVRPGVTGLLAEPKDASGLASAIHTLLTDEDLRRRCSEQSRSAILKDHRLEQQARAYRSIYNFMVETKTTD
jgi:glycosyltransferase involved in cell wall biosynthesis